MNDDHRYWDPTLKHRSSGPPAFPAAALPAVARHPVQSLFFSVDPWAIFSVAFYATCITFLWSILIYWAIHLVALGFEPRRLYSCTICGVGVAESPFDLSTEPHDHHAQTPDYVISFDTDLPNERGLAFLNLAGIGPICLTLISTDRSPQRPRLTRSYYVDWPRNWVDVPLNPGDLKLHSASVFFGKAPEAKMPIGAAIGDYE